MKSIEQILMDKIKEELLAGSKEEINEMIMFFLNENKKLVNKLEIAKEALELLQKYKAYNGDDWVSLECKKALEKLRGENDLG